MSVPPRKPPRDPSGPRRPSAGGPRRGPGARKPSSPANTGPRSEAGERKAERPARATADPQRSAPAGKRPPRSAKPTERGPSRTPRSDDPRRPAAEGERRAPGRPPRPARGAEARKPERPPGRRDRQRPTGDTPAAPRERPVPARARDADTDAPHASAKREPQRIAKFLARAGIASRREIERMIEARRIAINGVPIETPATIVTSLHGVTVDGTPVNAPAPARLFRYHKPSGLLTTERDPMGRPTIYDRLPRELPRVMPVGRLDLNTEGLLLLTTDGELKRQLELPRTGVTRTYRARAYGNVTQAQLEELIEGVEIEGVRYGSIDANLERRTGANVWVEMKLTEGKNREVRRVLEHLGLRVSRLIRTAYGPFPLADMPVGGVDEIRQHELVLFRKTLK